LQTILPYIAVGDNGNGLPGTVDQDVVGSIPVSFPDFRCPRHEGVFIKRCPLRGDGKGSSPFSHNQEQAAYPTTRQC